MQIIKKCDKYAPFLFIAAVLIHLFVMCGEFGDWEVPLRGRLLQLAFVLCAVKILMTYYELCEWIGLLAMGAMSVVSYVFTSDKYVVYVAVLIFAAKSVDMKIVLKIILDSVILTTLAVAVLSLAGVGNAYVDIRDYGRGMVESRYTLGFSHANNLHGTIWYIISIMIVLYKKKMDWRHYGVLTVINVCLFFFTASKAGFGVTQIVIIAGLLYRYANKYVWDKLYPYILGVVVFAGVIALTVISVTVDCFNGYGPILSKIDSITTGRLNIAYQSAYIGDWKAFSEGGSHIYPMDNGFASLVADYGYVIWAVFILFTVFLIYMAGKKRDGIIFALVLTCIIYTFMEKTYVLNDAYLLCNISYIAAMVMLGEKNPPVADNN